MRKSEKPEDIGEYLLVLATSAALRKRSSIEDKNAAMVFAPFPSIETSHHDRTRLRFSDNRIPVHYRRGGIFAVRAGWPFGQRQLGL